MLLKKSAFDVLMNKNKQNLLDKLKEKINTPSDSDSDVIVECVKRALPVSKKLTDTPPKQAIATAEANEEVRPPVSFEISSASIGLDTVFTKTFHVNQLANEENFFNSFQHVNLKFKKENLYDVNSIRLDQLLLNLKIEHPTKKQAAEFIQTEKKEELKETEEEEEVGELRQEFKERSRRNKRFSFVEPKRKKKPSQTSDIQAASMPMPEPIVETKFTRNKQDNYELWTEKYMFKSEDDIVTNSSQFERLKEWLKNWKSILKKETQSSSKKGQKDKYSAYDSSSDYSYDSDASNTDSAFGVSNKKKFYTNAILLSGPYGCGKTSAVHVIAKQLGFKVFEVNSSSLRCKTQIIQELEGAMNSHHVSSSNNNNNIISTINNSNPNKEITNLFDKKKTTISKADATIETANFKIDKFFKSSAEFQTANNFKIKEIETKTRKKRKISLRKETVLSIHSKKFKRNKKDENPTATAGLRRSKKHKKNSEDSEDDIQHQSHDDEEEDFENDSNQTHTTNSEESGVNIHKESLILFDEIDVVFREDVGFLAAINYFIKKSKKPIILTTNDEFLQEKINLNIEKVTFVMPRVDEATLYLKKISKQEKYDLDTPAAYKIIRDCKCDMRRALIQLQTLINSTLTPKPVNLPKPDSNDLIEYLPNALNNFEKSTYFENYFYLDQLTKKLKYHSNIYVEEEKNLKKYDLVLLKDGLSDNSSSCTNTSTFNPFLPMNSTTALQDHIEESIFYSDIERLHEHYNEYMFLFNKQNLVDLKDWSKHGLVDQFSYSSNMAVNKYAQNSLKPTTSRAVSLEYRPFLQQICQIEEIKQLSSKRRYNFHLPYMAMGLNKEDLSMLAKSNLAPKEIKSIKKETLDIDIYSVDDI